MVVHIHTTNIPVDDSLDLRRKRSRDIAATIVAHARYTTPPDRELVWAVYRDGLTARQIAHIRDESPRTIRARIRRVTARLISDRFKFVIRHRDAWPAQRRAIANTCILHGLSMRDAATELRISLHVIRREIALIHALMAEHRRAPRPSRAPKPNTLPTPRRDPAPRHTSTTTPPATIPQLHQ